MCLDNFFLNFQVHRALQHDPVYIRDSPLLDRLQPHWLRVLIHRPFPGYTPFHVHGMDWTLWETYTSLTISLSFKSSRIVFSDWLNHNSVWRPVIYLYLCEQQFSSILVYTQYSFDRHQSQRNLLWECSGFLSWHVLVFNGLCGFQYK